MTKDFLNDLEYLGVTARIKRLSDSLHYSMKELYATQGIDIEPSWHLIFIILKKNKSMSFVELAEKLNISKPALTKMISRMLGKGYINILGDTSDNRKKMVSLSDKAISSLPMFEKVWEAGQKAVQDMLAKNQHFLGSLSKFESKHSKLSFSDRALKYL